MSGPSAWAGGGWVGVGTGTALGARDRCDAASADLFFSAAFDGVEEVDVSGSNSTVSGFVGSVGSDGGMAAMRISITTSSTLAAIATKRAPARRWSGASFR
ncbi:hypothetical protein G432_16680 [Sphingomonas sp. MM-1]|nr:hypothetical protein G432_16680 [Sphingomonas sp. MM-1]